MEITYRHLPKRINNPQKAIIPKGIILHYYGNPGTSADANANYFHHVNDLVSVHYLVDDIKVIEIIPPIYKSYGTSNGAYNESYIQIEMAHPDSTGKISDKTLNNVVWLCRELIKKYNCTKIIRHYDATGKMCPLWYVNHPDEWDALVKRILKGDDVMSDKASDFSVKTALDYLAEKGVINTPAYWLKVAEVVTYFGDFLIKVASKLKAAGV